MKLRRQVGNLLAFWCPGCDTAHSVRVAPGKDPWTWNGNHDRPTFSPSVLAWHDGDIAQGGTIKPLRCHSFVRDGKIEFLGDCTHELASKTVELPEWPFAEERGKPRDYDPKIFEELSKLPQPPEDGD